MKELFKATLSRVTSFRNFREYGWRINWNYTDNPFNFEIHSVALLFVKWPASVAPERNLMNLLHAGDKACTVDLKPRADKVQMRGTIGWTKRTQVLKKLRKKKFIDPIVVYEDGSIVPVAVKFSYVGNSATLWNLVRIFWSPQKDRIHWTFISVTMDRSWKTVQYGNLTLLSFSRVVRSLQIRLCSRVFVHIGNVTN